MKNGVNDYGGLVQRNEEGRGGKRRKQVMIGVDARVMMSLFRCERSD